MGSTHIGKNKYPLLGYTFFHAAEDYTQLYFHKLVTEIFPACTLHCNHSMPSHFQKFQLPTWALHKLIFYLQDLNIQIQDLI